MADVIDVANDYAVDSIEYFLNGKRFTYRPVELIEAHAELCLMPDSEFEQPHVLARALHLACMLCYVLGTPASECLSDVGVIHQLAHLIHLDEPAVDLQEVRRAFTDVLPADCVALKVSPIAGKSQHDRDSKELRRMCAERDQLKSECELLRKTIKQMSPHPVKFKFGQDNKCLACGGYHYGNRGLPCPKMGAIARAVSHG